MHDAGRRKYRRGYRRNLRYTRRVLLRLTIDEPDNH